MKCSVCGTSLSPGMTQCAACGSPLAINAPLEVALSESVSSVVTSLPEAGEQQVAEQHQTPPPFTPQEPPGRKFRSRRGGWSLVVAVVMLLLLGSSGLTYYLAVYQPNQRIEQATATARALQQQQRSTATAQANATAQAQANATATAQAQASATVAALQTIYTQATTGSPTLTDSLAQNGADQWVEYQASDGSCAFENGGLHATGVGLCPALATTYHDLAYQARVTFIGGSGIGGLLFHFDRTSKQFYCFTVRPDGTYIVFRGQLRSDGGMLLKILANGSSEQIHSGLNQTNLLSVVARGQSLYFYVNQQYVDHVEDGTTPSGMIGVVTLKFGGTPDVVFRQAQVWTR